MALYNQGDIINDFLVKMNQSTTVGFYTDAILTRFASNAHAYAASKYNWPMTEGRVSTTLASLTTSEDGYTTLEYPEGFRSDSIRLLTIGGKRFDKKNFFKFQSFLEDNTGETSKVYTDYVRRVYINPNHGATGTVAAWGQYNVAPLATDSNIQDPSALTIFSGIAEDGNEAIVEKMIAYARQREKDPNYVLHSQIADKILETVWGRIQGEQSLYQDTPDDGMFKRIDIVNGGFTTDIFKRDQF